MGTLLFLSFPLFLLLVLLFIVLFLVTLLLLDLWRIFQFRANLQQ